MSANNALRDEALAWLVRTGDSEFTDWEGFTAWLEADPQRADEYHRLADSAQLMMPLVASSSPVQDNVPPARSWGGRWAAAASVAMAGLLGGAVAVQSFSADSYAARPGEVRTVDLGDGDTMLLNGGTRVKVSGWSRRDVRLEEGQALFRLAGAERLEVQSGDLEIVDIGTVFEVTRTGLQNRVVVDEGAVMVDPDGARLRIAQGQQLEARDGATRLAAVPAPAGAAGAWTRGQLVYLDAPIAEVGTDLSRSTGVAFSTSSAMATQRFSGTLSIAEVRRDPTTLEPLLGVPVRPAGTGWRLGEGR